ncbi:GNAT family N-acetyltransferase [Acidocella sp.]|uniref:GNAT family N-acetyltransferase n=1 Tax=Acidocella sp. TaxID=50710 RepID=UPI002630F4F3|nr:GNAT family N-acetyltransferase [Acidocella sp.]
MISIRRARLSDASGIATVHVATWRSAYANVLPDYYLANLSLARLANEYEHGIRIGESLHVAACYSEPGAPPILGFSSAARRRDSQLGDGEVETLYVLDDYRERGLGGQLLRASAKHLAQLGCRSVFAWVLSENPSRYFYERLGGKRTASGTTRVGGEDIPQIAFVWDPIETLLDVNA